jgi:uncharacterized membrane protein
MMTQTMNEAPVSAYQHSSLKRYRQSRCARQICLSAYWLLLVAMIVTSLPAVLPEGASFAPVLMVKLVPLLLVLYGLLKDRLRAFIWLCFIDLLYFTQAVVEVFLSQGDILDVSITALTVLIFCAAMMYIKWEKAAGREL